MNCSRVRDLLPELADPRTPAAAQPGARAHLAGCADCQRAFAGLQQTAAAMDQLPVPPPSPRLRQNFQAMLAAEKRALAAAPAPVTEPTIRRGTPSWWRNLVSPLAGCALLALGFFAGTRFGTLPPPAAAPADPATAAKLAELQRKVDTVGQLVGYSLLQQQQRPTNDRLRGVLASARAEHPSDKVLDDLLSAVAFDPSNHVRLRALEALYPHADRGLVRQGILAALPREQDPLVQLELIEFVASAQDRNAAPVLETLAQNASANTSVRDAAQRALTRL